MSEHDPFNLPEPTAEERQQKHFLPSKEAKRRAIHPKIPMLYTLTYILVSKGILFRRTPVSMIELTELPQRDIESRDLQRTENLLLINDISVSGRLIFGCL